MKVAFFDTKEYDRRYFEPYARRAGIEMEYFGVGLEEGSADLARGADCVCIFVNDRANGAVLDRLEECGVRGIALRCAGYNNVDLKSAAGRFRVVHVPSYSPHAVAEHTAAMMLCAVRRIHKAYNRTREFNFSLEGLEGFDLYKKTVGIIGTGRIGRVFAGICRGFGMRVLAYDMVPGGCAEAEYTDLARLYRESDVLSFHCPLTPQSYHMLDARALKDCKDGVVILNTSRGALIDAQALLQGIKEEKIGAACLDVYEEEAEVFFKDISGKIPRDDVLSGLISMPNVLVTSHQAFLTKEALEAIAATTVQNLVLLSKGAACENELFYYFADTKKERV